MTSVPEPTSTGVDSRLASVLCYAGWWVTGLVFLFAERQHRGVRFHAAQSLLVCRCVACLPVDVVPLWQEKQLPTTCA